MLFYSGRMVCTVDGPSAADSPPRLRERTNMPARGVVDKGNWTAICPSRTVDPLPYFLGISRST